MKIIWRKCEIMRREEISWSGKAPELYSGGGRFESWPRHRVSRMRFLRLSSNPAGKFVDNTTNQATKATFPILFNTSFSNLNFRLCITLRSYINRKRINKLSWCETDTSACNLGCYGNECTGNRKYLGHCFLECKITTWRRCVDFLQVSIWWQEVSLELGMRNFI